MVSKVNVKARIKRHSRILKEDINKLNPIRWAHNNSRFKALLTAFVAVTPLYPSFFTMVYWNNAVFEFNRWEIDESSIISAFSDEDESESYANNSFLSVEVSSDTKRDLSWTSEIIVHTIKKWESFDSIANDFGISKDSIHWANNTADNSELKVWETIKIPPVSWLIYKVESWDTLWSIAEKYDIKVDVIIEQNNLWDSTLRKGQEIILPGAEKIIVVPDVIVAPQAAPVYAKAKAQDGNTTYAKPAPQAYTPPVSGWYTLRRRQPQHTFYWGNCTRFVGQYKNVNWWGNANQWLANARAKWHATWTQAKPWAIIVFGGGGYNPRYGHVGIVQKVTGNQMVVVDMNYRRLNEVTYRNVTVGSAWIVWYIYVD